MAEVKHFFMLLVPCLIFFPLQNGLLIVFAYFFRKLLVFDSQHLFYIMVSLAFLLLCITKLISWLELQKSREIELYQST